MGKPKPILLIADDGVAQSLRPHLEPEFDVSHFDGPGNATSSIAIKKYICVVLSEAAVKKMALEAAMGLLGQAGLPPTIPVVVIANNEESGMKSLLGGAHDFVVLEDPNNGGAAEIRKLVCKSIARAHVLEARFSPDQNAALAMESHAASTSSMFYWTSSSVTARNYGMVTLQSAIPERFEEFSRQFSELVEKCFEERLYRVSQPVSAELSDLALELGALRAGPRDVVEIYGHSLKQRVKSTSRIRGAAYADVGQLLALELMGYLVSYYRNLSRVAFASSTEER